VLFKEVHLHNIARDERCLILFVTELVPVDVGEPGVLLDFADRLRSLTHVFSQESRDQVAQKHFIRPIPRDSYQSQVRLVLQNAPDGVPSIAFEVEEWRDSHNEFVEQASESPQV